jgi:hypothetical protein
MPRKASAVNARNCFGVCGDLAVCFVRAIVNLNFSFSFSSYYY